MQPLLKGKKILIAPLEWGLGHATRCMPLIDALLKEGAEVHIGGDGDSFKLLKEAYPFLPAHDLPAYEIEYPSGNSGAWKTLFKAPAIIRNIQREHTEVEKLVGELQLDAIISDNRYGAWSQQIPCIFMCHQVRVLPPKPFRWGAGAILRWHKHFIHKFSALWIPDFEEAPGLGGILSHGFTFNIPIHYVGTLSRFKDLPAENKMGNEIVAVLSGPEPQRTILEAHLIAQLKTLDRPCTLVRGVVSKEDEFTDGKVRIISYLHKEALLNLISSTEVVICRSGYSTVMDLCTLKKKAIFIPTPGQTEQEYLAQNLSAKGMTVMQYQNDIQLKTAMDQVKSLKPLAFEGHDNNSLGRAIYGLSKML